MEAVHVAETRLIDKLKRHRAKHMHLDAKRYVDEWVLFGLTIPKKNGMMYSEKWLRDIARAADIKQRFAPEGEKLGRKPKTDAEKRKFAIAKLKKDLLALKLTPAELKEFTRDLAKR